MTAQLDSRRLGVRNFTIRPPGSLDRVIREVLGCASGARRLSRAPCVVRPVRSRSSVAASSSCTTRCWMAPLARLGGGVPAFRRGVEERRFSYVETNITGATPGAASRRCSTATAPPIAKAGLKRIAQLYNIEDKIRGEPPALSVRGRGTCPRPGPFRQTALVDRTSACRRARVLHEDYGATGLGSHLMLEVRICMCTMSPARSRWSPNQHSPFEHVPQLGEVVAVLRESRARLVGDDARNGRVRLLRSGMEDHLRDVAEPPLVPRMVRGRRTTGGCFAALLSGTRGPVELDMPRSSQSRPIPWGRVYSTAETAAVA